MLEVKDLHAGYGRLEILRGINLDVQEGEIVALLGSNGAGKSTLNNTLSGICKRLSGVVMFDGQDISGETSSHIVARGLIHVPEGRRIFPNLSVEENLLVGSFRRGKARRQANLQYCMTTFPKLAQRRTQLAGTLSGGEQQMLAIGRALMAEPKLLILDEPSLGLSPLMVGQMFSLIERLNQDGLAILLVEQNVIQSMRIAHRAYVLDNGRITMQGPASELSADENLRRAYLGM